MSLDPLKDVLCRDQSKQKCSVTTTSVQTILRQLMKKLWLRENYIMPMDLHLFFFAGKKELTVPKAMSFSYSRAQILMLACGTKASATFKKLCNAQMLL